jgi:excisionase family DNA binding protein
MPLEQIGRNGQYGTVDTEGTGRMAAKSLTMSVSEAAAVLGISRSAAYDAAMKGDLPNIRLGRRILVSREALERLLKFESPKVSG